MPDRPGRSSDPVLYVVACGGRPAGDLGAAIPDLQVDGWDVCVVATPSALMFTDTGTLSELTGRPVRYDYKQPDEPDAFPPADAFVVAPATFNTINKWANGISDTLALGRQAEVNSREGETIANLTRALAQVPAACITIGSLVILKYQVDGQPILHPRELTAREMRALERFPDLQKNPARFLESLADAVAIPSTTP
jgi:hypothetical protein